MQLAQYIRMSTLLQQDSPETQKSIIREYCQRNGHVIAKTYEDSAISGGSMEKRDALIELIVDAEKRLFEGVIIYKYDRAFRNLAEQLVTIKRLQKHGIKIMAAADPNSDGASGELIVNILGAVNQFERQITGERIYDKNRELAKKGRWTGSGINPTGYWYDRKTKTLAVVEDEAETIRLIFDLYLKEKSISSVVDILHDMDRKTKLGCDWTNERAHNVLINPLYAGKIRWGFNKPGKQGKNRNCEVFDGQHKAIVGLETFNKVQDTLKYNRNHTSGRSGRIYLLGGLLRCSICGGIVASQYKAHLNKHVHYCKERYTQHKDFCKGWSRVAYKIENAVYAALTKNIRNVEAFQWERGEPAPPTDRNRQIEKKIKALEAKLLRQIEMYEEGVINKDIFKVRRTKTLLEKERLEAELKQVTSSDNEDICAVLGEFEVLWGDANLKERKELLKKLIHIIHTDGHTAKIEFADFRLPGWSLEAEVPIK